MSKILRDRIDIVPAESIIPFEWSNLDQSRIYCDSNDSDVVHHPFMVAALDDGEYLLLNQSELFYQLCSIGVNYLPVQISNQVDLTVSGERVILTGFKPSNLSDLVVHNPEHMFLGDVDSKSPFSESVNLKLEFVGDSPRQLFLRHSTRLGCPEPMSRLFEAIQKVGRYLPEIEEDNLQGTPLRLACPDCVMTLPGFTVNDLTTAARSDRLFPPNIIKITDGLRILNLDFPLRILRTDLPLSELQLFLKDLLAYREQARRTSYVEGRVYILNR